MRSLDVRIIGGGPGGLYLARLLRLADPSCRVTVYERNLSDATFGFGVVFSDRTLGEFERADPKTHARLIDASPHWTDMEIRFRGEALRYGGFGFTAIERETLLRILREQATDAGADVILGQPSGLADFSGSGADIVVAADGVNSQARTALAEHVCPSIETGAAKYIWFGTPQHFDIVTFPFVTGEHGTFAAHAYPYTDGLSCFIVEVDEGTWQRAGMAESASQCKEPGRSDEYSRRYLQDLFAEHLHGHELLVNNSKWANFREVRNRRWHHGRVVLLGDAAHTAHFSVGSGTKLAMEDSIALARALAHEESTEGAFRAYERARRPAVERTQRAARPSQRWWETYAARLHLEPEQFGYHFLTRTKAIGYRGLRLRDPARIAAVESWFADRHPARDEAPSGGCHALTRPVTVGPLALPSRLVADIGTREGRIDALDISAALRAGAGMALADMRDRPQCRPLSGASEESDPVRAWQRCLDELADAGIVGARLTAEDTSGAALVARAGFRAVQLDLGDDLTQPVSVLARQRELLGDHVMLAVTMRPPDGDAWSPAASETLARCVALAEAGADLVRLGGPGVAVGAVESAHLPHLDLLDRIRTETGLATCADGGTGWALSAPADPSATWPEEIHVALLSGRIDLMAGWPLTSPGWPAPYRGTQVRAASAEGRDGF